MKNKVFTRPEVRRELDRFVFVELDVSKPPPEGPKNAELHEKKYMSNDLPLYVILDAAGGEVTRLNYAELNPSKWVTFLREAAAQAGS